MRKNILIITNSYDLTADYLIKKFSDKITFFRLNVDLVETYNIHLGTSINTIEYKNNNHKIDLNLCDAIYFRKLSPPDFTEYNILYHNFMLQEILAIINGIAETFGNKVLSPPSILKRADNKILQLNLARKIGFHILDSLITNNEQAVSTFSQSSDKKKFIIKPISIGRIIDQQTQYTIQTNLINSSMPLENLELSPSYFQNYLDKDFEIRTTVIGNKFFSVRIDSDNKVDWRKKNANIKYSLFKLPKTLENKCLQLMKELNIQFAAFDFLVKDSETFFLELNANGQWLWLEHELSIPISDEIIKYLTGDVKNTV